MKTITSAIAAQVLCNLAKSDPAARILDDFDALFAVTGDDRFVTARHCLQSLWKVGVAGKSQEQRLLVALERHFNDCVSHKNCTLIRFDIIESLHKLYDALNNDKIREVALQLISTETDEKYRKKYATLWKPVKPKKGT